jgi:epoxyqueuosine reductase
MTPAELARLAKDASARLGFSACGICDLRPIETRAAFEAWLAAGYHGEMRYMARQAPVRREPQRAWKGARSAVVVLHNYYCADGLVPAGYRVARYAQGEDYHSVTLRLLEKLGAELRAADDSSSFRCFVDAGPLPERELARRAGLGWYGKNTMLINPRLGSYLFIGVLLTDLLLARDEPFEADRCGSCTRCLEACPTSAFPEPGVLDSTRCVSYLTIESRSETPEALRSGVGDNLFGCDICQEVCPWNGKFSAPAAEPDFAPRRDWPSLEAIAAMDDAAFGERFGPTALERARPDGLRRNALVVMENLRATR